MLPSRPRILDFDGSVIRQRAFVEATNARIVDLRALGPTVRHWASRDFQNILQPALNTTETSAVTFLGSGDFHHLSAFLIQQFEAPLSVVVFDHHPDWDILPPKFGCGAWINRALEQRNVERVLHVGSASTDLEYPGLMTANLRSVKSGRLVLLPAVSKDSLPRALAKHLIGDLTFEAVEKFRDQVRQLPTTDVYISIDKDCLWRDFAATNWEEGELSLSLLQTFIEILKTHRNIVGVDVVGDYSKPYYKGSWKRLCGWFDHPKKPTGKSLVESEIAILNGNTNKILFETLARSSQGGS